MEIPTEVLAALKNIESESGKPVTDIGITETHLNPNNEITGWSVKYLLAGEAKDITVNKE